MIVRPAEPGDFGGMQQLASRVWPSGWHPGGLGWGLSRNALADSVVVAVDEDGSAPIVGPPIATASAGTRACTTRPMRGIASPRVVVSEHSM